jgi:NhaP-type Na+/H+ or K+/H+ antiporter
VPKVCSGRLIFDNALMQGMLCFLLFAGALQIDLNYLSEQKSVIAPLAIVGESFPCLFLARRFIFCLAGLG